MTKDDIIRMLHEVGYPDYANEADPRVVAFANLVAAAEREACAKLCDVLAVHPEYASEVTKLAAMAIRARSQS